MPGQWRTQSTSVQTVLVEACWRPMPRGDGRDFYDVVDLRDGRVALTVGEAGGDGATAAERADDLRATVRRMFRRTDQPAEVLALLDVGIVGAGRDTVATVSCAVVDPATRTIEVARAGPLPILFVTAGNAFVPEDPPGPPLGLGAARSSTVHPLGGEATVFLCTNGVVGRATTSLDDAKAEQVDDALAKLGAVGRDLHGALASAAELARRATARLGQPTGDATVLSVRLLGSAARRSAEADPIGVRPRVVLRAYLDSRDLRSERAESVLAELALQTRETLDYVMEILDVSQPGVDTERDGVLAAPTVIRLSPPPVIRVVGSVRSVDELAQGLQLPLDRVDA